MHVDGDHRGPLLDGKSHQRSVHHNCRLYLGGAVGDRIGVLQGHRRPGLGAAQPIQAGVERDAVQPAADRGVVPEGAGATVRRQHRFLQRIVGIFSRHADEPGEPVELVTMTPEQLGECVRVAGHMGGQ